MNYYNEHDPKAAAWLRELIAQGHLPPGFVDSRDIQLVQPADLVGYTQCHFFAGIGGWSLALLLAGVPTTTPLWTGSCPCQPFSVAGKGLGKTDPRHLWPQFRRLIRLCRPPVVFGEQVASAAGRIWLSGVCADLEALAYRTAAADLCAAGGAEDCEIGILRGDSPLAWERATLSAPHLRQRLWWCAGRLADAEDSHRRSQQSERPARRWWDGPAGMRSTSGLGFTDGPRWQPGKSTTTPPGHGHPSQPASTDHHRLEYTAGLGWQQWRAESSRRSPQCGCSHGTLGMAHTPDHGRPEHESEPGNGPRRLPGPSDTAERAGTGGMGNTNDPGCSQYCRTCAVPTPCVASELRSDSSGVEHTTLSQSPRLGPLSQFLPGQATGGHASPWATFDLIPCRDGKARRIESGTFPLVDGLPGRVGLLRGYGNAIVSQRAADFIQASLEALQEQSEAGTPACSGSSL